MANMQLSCDVIVYFLSADLNVCNDHEHAADDGIGFGPCSGE
ncbi:hypothetical protein ABIE45_006419, partial [Methylobacterium sp. OAE515]